LIAIQIDQTGGPEVMRCRDVPDPKAVPWQLLVDAPLVATCSAAHCKRSNPADSW
jgi:NADPH:quinone reductase-like Zn-dependent oxidoreductase